MPRKVILVDNGDAYCSAVRTQLRRLGHDARLVRTGEEALLEAEHNPPDVLITSLRLRSQLDGLTLAKILKLQNPDLKVIFVSANPDAITEKSPPFPYQLLGKPVGILELIEHVGV
jgi:CheY-like chemotaxis protein